MSTNSTVHFYDEVSPRKLIINLTVGSVLLVIILLNLIMLAVYKRVTRRPPTGHHSKKDDHATVEAGHREKEESGNQGNQGMQESGYQEIEESLDKVLASDVQKKHCENADTHIEQMFSVAGCNGDAKNTGEERVGESNGIGNGESNMKSTDESNGETESKEICNSENKCNENSNYSESSSNSNDNSNGGSKDKIKHSSNSIGDGNSNGESMDSDCDTNNSKKAGSSSGENEKCDSGKNRTGTDDTNGDSDAKNTCNSDSDNSDGDNIDGDNSKDIDGDDTVVQKCSSTADPSNSPHQLSAKMSTKSRVSLDLELTNHRETMAMVSMDARSNQNLDQSCDKLPNSDECDDPDQSTEETALDNNSSHRSATNELQQASSPHSDRSGESKNSNPVSIQPSQSDAGNEETHGSNITPGQREEKQILTNSDTFNDQERHRQETQCMKEKRLTFYVFNETSEATETKCETSEDDSGMEMQKDSMKDQGKDRTLRGFCVLMGHLHKTAT